MEKEITSDTKDTSSTNMNEELYGKQEWMLSATEGWDMQVEELYVFM